jgi:hypothetical protein
MILDTLDKSFLRLVTDFSVAKSEMMVNSQYINKDTIVLSPNSKYLQISNSLTNIAFDDSYIVSLVDCADNVMLDITNKIYINEFQDINGVYQIAFEIAPIKKDFFNENLFLRFEHTGSDLVLWSNPILVTDTIQTIRIDYRNFSYYEGISYDRANYFQSIEIAGFFNLPSSKENTVLTTLSNGDIRRSRTTQELEYTYNIEAIDTFAFGRLMAALNSEVVYINGTRFVTSENVQSDERQGMSNQFATTFKGQFIAIDTYVSSYQIAPALIITSLFPLNSYTLSPTTATAIFNNNLVSVSNFKLWNYDTDALIEDLNSSIFNNTFSASFGSVGLGTYYFTFDAIDTLGQVLNVTDKETWKFRIVNPQYKETQYNNNQYITD